MNTLHPRIYSWFYIAMIPLSLNLSKYNIYVVHIRHEFLPGGLFETSTYTSLIAVEVYMNLNRERRVRGKQTVMRFSFIYGQKFKLYFQHV